MATVTLDHLSKLRIRRRMNAATTDVTHDQVEAITLGHQATVMRSGVLQQADHPQVPDNHPDNLFVAAFAGSPAMNLNEPSLAEALGSVLVAHFTIDARRAQAQGATSDEDATAESGGGVACADPSDKVTAGSPGVSASRPRHLTCCVPTCASRATSCGSRSSRSRTSRAATSCCPPWATRWPSSWR